MGRPALSEGAKQIMWVIIVICIGVLWMLAGFSCQNRALRQHSPLPSEVETCGENKAYCVTVTRG